MQATCRCCLVELRRGSRLLALQTAPAVLASGTGCWGAASSCHLSRRDHATDSTKGLQLPKSDDWEDFVAQCRKQGQDAESAAEPANSQPLEQASDKTEFSLQQELSSLPSPPTGAAPAEKVSPGAAREVLTISTKVSREAAAFSAPVFPGEAYIQNRPSARHSGTRSLCMLATCSC